jgi:hypothetical protein
MNLSLVLFIVAAVLAGIALVQSRGQALVAWAALAIAVGLILPRL